MLLRRPLECHSGVFLFPSVLMHIYWLVLMSNHRILFKEKASVPLPPALLGARRAPEVGARVALCLACHISRCVIPAVKSAVAGAMASRASHGGAVKITSVDVCVSVISEKLAKAPLGERKGRRHAMGSSVISLFQSDGERESKGGESVSLIIRRALSCSLRY